MARQWSSSHHSWRTGCSVTCAYTKGVRWGGCRRKRHGEARDTGAVGGPDHWTLHAPHQGVHSSLKGTRSAAVGRRAVRAPLPAQSAIQPTAIVNRPAFRPPSLPIHARTGWFPACGSGFHQSRLEKSEFPWLRGLYADLGVPKTSRPLGDACQVREDCDHVCRSRSLALSSLPDFGRITGARH